MTDLGTLGGTFSDSAGINNRHQIVGASTVASGQQHAYMFSKGKMTDLNELIPVDSGWILVAATGINNAGDFVGNGRIKGQTHAFLLSGCPLMSIAFDFQDAQRVLVKTERESIGLGHPAQRSRSSVRFPVPIDALDLRISAARVLLLGCKLTWMLSGFHQRSGRCFPWPAAPPRRGAQSAP
jgi:probable HAF family extracellular repeat protein